jgi:hypothetical protein
MKQKILKITPEELIRTLQGNPTQQLNLPPNTELLDIKYDAILNQVIAVIRNDAFEEVTEGTSNPEFTFKTTTLSQHSQIKTPIITSITEPVNPSNIVSTENSVTTQINSTPSQKSFFPTLTASQSSPTNIGTGVKTLGPKPETNVDTCGFEDEFTKEQRKVLKFVSDGNFVIVKPIQFLKTEWEDINDTVKSIGGKWVKGGTIDYWAIPKNIKKE